ncbi:MAG: SpoIID/LytB domain-containing protein [Clostridia bacterium]|jgi:peptidoglycan hydrolase-like protein with peptidoglycan-binding domain
MSETNRALIPFTNEHFAAFVQKMIGGPYWYGTCLYKCTSSALSRKTSQYPSHYGSNRTARYKQDIAAKKVAADCIGAAKGYAWTGGGQGVLEAIGTDKTFASKYGSNGCPDKGANSMFSYAKSKGMDWGAISTLPEIVGVALHKSGHVGYYIGGGYAVEWRGFNYGCVKTKVAGRGWTHWYKLPFIKYGAISVIAPDVDTPVTDTVRNLSYKAGKSLLRGEDVRKLQVDLNAMGFDCGDTDGIFGKKTDAAVRAFQAANNLEVDGIVGTKTRSALELALESIGATGDEAQAPADKPSEGDADTGETQAPDEPVTDSDEDDPDEDEDGNYIKPEAPDALDYGTRLLRYRSGRTMLTGDDVAAVQTRLTQLGFDPGAVDGIYGSKTASAVKQLQMLAGIEVDGIVGNDTRKALREWTCADKPTLTEQPSVTQPTTIRIKMTREENIAVYGVEEISLDIEDYLRGVVPSEMYESASIEALKAQAICARTYAYYRRNSVLSDTTNHQSFHAGKIGKNPRSDEAITETKGQVLTYDGKLVNCFYCASNKGVTKRSGDVWSTHYPYYVTKTDEWDEAARKERNVTSFGHGIGMSQHGAMWAAKNGVDCASILAFYYDGAAITDNYNA